MPSLRVVVAGILFVLVLVQPAQAIGPDDVYLLVNKNDSASREIANYYCHKRGVPLSHILVFDLPAREDCSRADYDRKLVLPVREKLKGLRDKPLVLLAVYGIPLRIGAKEPSASEQKERDDLNEIADQNRKQIAEVDGKIRSLEAALKGVQSGPAGEELNLRRKEKATVERALKSLEGRIKWVSYAESEAALDSELSLLWYDHYELRKMQLNLLYFQVPDTIRKNKPPMVMTARLDGPNPAVVKRMIDDAVATEEVGLNGKVYVDARGIRFDPKDSTGYGGYDESMREMARLLEKDGKMSVVLDDKPALFAPGSCPECALYCGWYSLGNFVDCCQFERGAVAWHLASGEAITLHDPRTKQWCKNLLERGAAATLGPVAEPYTVGFPKPAEFFGFLCTGDYTLVESYWKSQMLASWMTTLIGDPLYNPYKKNPRLKVDQVKPSPAGGKLPFSW